VRILQEESSKTAMGSDKKGGGGNITKYNHRSEYEQNGPTTSTIQNCGMQFILLITCALHIP
jgi:hypothetical protein